MMGKTNLQGDDQANFREIFRRLNDFASVTIAFTTADSTMSAAHTLGRPPVGFQKIMSTKPTSIYYDGDPLGTQTRIRLKADNSNLTATIRVF